MLFTPNDLSNMPNSIRLWWTLVKEDIESSKALLEVGQHRNSVLLSASTLEKSLKGYLFREGRLEETDTTHNTFELAKKCGFWTLSHKVFWIPSELRKIHVPTSYPDSDWTYKAVSQPGYAAMVYNETSKAIAWIFGRMKDGGGELHG